MECAIACKKGFVLQASSGQYLRPLQVSWKPLVIRTALLGGEVLMFLSLAQWGRAGVFKSFERKNEDSAEGGGTWSYRNAKCIRACVGQVPLPRTSVSLQAGLDRNAYSIIPCPCLPVRNCGPHFCLEDKNAIV